ncbi:salicylate 1-hydroxylase-like protein [Rhexocercosporidium sp. MPI-PUGE-AT-0058]|nr:salicylate 1-hydroxylase-like protein [Rhexocercosporidium sp. MPI-PUGE-AT-0058]
MSRPHQPSIAIIGGGLGGLTLSIGLTHHNIPHKIYESTSAFAEIGAGIALGPNSITALELIDPRIKGVLERCVSYNEGLDSKGRGEGREEWLDVRSGEEKDFNELITTIRHMGSPKPGRACVHRARFLEGLVDLIPPSIPQFSKSLISITSLPSANPSIDQLQLSLLFSDGTTATADAVIACDGIKSTIRQNYVLDLSSDVSRPVPTGDVAYRGMFSRDDFLGIVGGTIDAGKGTLFCGQESYVVMYPVEKGSMMNMVAIKRLSSSSQTQTHDSKTWLHSVSYETMLSDFVNWGTPIRDLLKQFKSSQRWALYDHLPVPTYVRGRVALMGDAAHATTPHQGQGAGMAFEDALVLSNIMGQVLTKTSTDTSSSSSSSSTSEKDGEEAKSDFSEEIEACFQAYDGVRRARTQRVTETSRQMGEVVRFVGEGIGRDFAKMKRDLDGRMQWIWDVDLPGEIERGVDIAEGVLRRRGGV